MEHRQTVSPHGRHGFRRRRHHRLHRSRGYVRMPQLRLLRLLLWHRMGLGLYINGT